MGKQSKAGRSDKVGQSKVTTAQIAFIVDRYLCDNNYSQTRSVFRTEASSLLSRSPMHEAPKGLLSLGSMLNEYICLKEEKLLMDQEKGRLEQEKCRIQMLLQGMQGVMNSYNAHGVLSTPAISVVPVNTSSAVSTLSNPTIEPENFSSPTTHAASIKKRKDLKDVQEAPPAVKKSRNKLAPQKLPNTAADIVSQSNNACNSKDVQQSSARQLPLQRNEPDVSLVQGSSVVKRLFNQPMLSHPTNSSCPKTPPQATSSQSDKFVSPLEISSTANCTNSTPQEITPASCTVPSSDRVRTSPFKQIAYYTMERSQHIYSSPAKTNIKGLTKRDHVKGRLDFDASDVQANSYKPIAEDILTSHAGNEMNILDMDFPNLDLLGSEFSLSEFLVDFDFGCEENDYSSHELDASTDNSLGLSNKSRDCKGFDQPMPELTSTVKVLSGKDMNIQGSDTTLTTVKSITKRITILSPAKSSGSSLNRKNWSA